MGRSAPASLDLSHLSAAGVADAREKRGVLDSGLRRLHGAGTVAGPAVTARCAEGSASAMLRALEQARAGSVVVAQGAGEWAYFGELAGAEAVRRGVVAVVVDGLLRDLERQRELDLALYARGTTPRGALPGGGGEVGVTLTVGEVEIAPGDWIVADADGVVAVPAGEIAGAVARAEEIEAVEARAWADVRGGMSLFERASQYGAPLGQRMREGA